MQLNSVFLIIFVCSKNVITHARLNNVCPTIADYSIKEANPRCWYDPDVNANVEEIVRRHGYPCEIHEIISNDGYIFKLYRIPHGKLNSNSTRPKPPVFLHHGIVGNARFWVGIPRKSLAFKLADFGYDCWIANARGSENSVGHKNLDIREAKYWNFTFEEIALLDLPKTLSYIKNVTGGERKVSYIGYSMGCTIAMVYSSMKAKHAQEYIDAFYMVAPVIYTTKFNPLFKPIVPVRDQIEMIGTLLGIYKFGPSNNWERLYICTVFAFIEPCKFIFFLLVGFDYRSYEAQDIPHIMINMFSSSSLKTAQHYAQNVDDKGRFRRFDYGSTKNIELYGTPHPPDYNIKNVKKAVHIFHGLSDPFSPEEDALLFYNTLETEKSILAVENEEGKAYNHFDFGIARNIDQAFHRPLLNILSKYSPPM